MMYDFLDEFNKEFGTKLEESNKDLQIANRLFHDFIEQEFKTSDVYKSIADKIIQILDELETTLTPKQKELLDKFELYKDELSNYTAEQSFVYGLCFHKALNTELNNYSQKMQIQRIKELYKAGTKIELKKMYDVQAVPPNTIGIVDFVDDIGTIHVKWENGSSLGVIYGKDKFKIVKDD